ncbi:MAG: EamA family transporter [Acidimicrobiia bacterium]|nr:MAG: EamA family transporter [Acidimicrobiia bacterium]
MRTQWETRRPLLPELALVAATVAYGATFVVVQDALERVTPVGFILLRFAVGAAVLAPFALRRGWRRAGVSEPARAFAVAALAFGVVGFAGYWFQNAGLQRTTTSNSAFITGLFVVFTPLVETVVRRQPPPRNVLVAVVVSASGLFLLTGAELSMNAGDALTLGCALMFGIWIYLGGEYSQRFDPVALTAAQMAVFASLAVPVVAVGGLGALDAQVLVAVAVTGVLCSAVAFSLQLWAQRYVEPSRAAVILLFEPVVAGFVGYAVGERLGVAGYVGAVVILAGILLAESRSWRRREPVGRGPGAV